MRIDLAVICDYALIDQLGKLSVLGIFENLWIPRFPAVPPRVHLVMRLKGRRTELGQHRVRIRLVDNQEDEILSGEGTVTFNEPPAGVTEIEAGTVLVFDVPLARPGRYEFRILVDDDISTIVPMQVTQTPTHGNPSRAEPGDA